MNGPVLVLGFQECDKTSYEGLECKNRYRQQVNFMSRHKHNIHGLQSSSDASEKVFGLETALLGKQCRNWRAQTALCRVLVENYSIGARCLLF